MSALAGIRVVDLTHQGPGPHCTGLLGDFGADVVVVERVGVHADGGESDARARLMPSRRNKRSICLDLKAPQGREVFDALAGRADVVVEGYRPGVAQRLGVDYPRLRERNERLVYCSITGYGQTGPRARAAGHDINYIATTGALALMGARSGERAIPMNLVADYGGGALLAAFSIAMALFARERTGVGQFVDLAMTDGVLAQLGRIFADYFTDGEVPPPGGHRLSGGIPEYGVYRCADGAELAVGALEPHLFRNLCRALELSEHADAQHDPGRRHAVRRAFEARFATRPRDAWLEHLAGFDACVTPVHDLAAAAADPHNVARGMFVRRDAELQVGVAPKMSETPGSIRTPGVRSGASADTVLAELGYDAERIAALRTAGVIPSGERK